MSYKRSAYYTEMRLFFPPLHSISYTDLRCSQRFVVLSVSSLISFPLSNSLSSSRRRSKTVLWDCIKRRWQSQGRLKMDWWKIRADRQHICWSQKLSELEEEWMKYMQRWQMLCWENTMSCIIRPIGNLETPAFQGLVSQWCSHIKTHSKLPKFLQLKWFP